MRSSARPQCITLPSSHVHLRLQRTQNLLYESTRDFLQLKFDTRAHEKSWMVEKDRLLRELDSCHNRLRKAGSSGAELGRTWQPSSSAALLLPRSQPDLQQPHKEELKAIFVPFFILRDMAIYSNCGSKEIFVVGRFLMTLFKLISFLRQCRRIWSRPTVWQRCTGSSVLLWRQNWPKSERKGTWAGKYLRYHVWTDAYACKILIHTSDCFLYALWWFPCFLLTISWTH